MSKVELTTEQKSIIKLIPPGYRYLAKDEDGEIFAYTDKPTKRRDYKIWEITNGLSFDLEKPNAVFFLGSFKCLFPDDVLSWKDSEPLCIADLR